ncbi:MAG: hypothetical protein KDD06_07230, partial [Phaeodactylibacter sp.]|nr:hypothetical protein [Phaeodactylibacter sp.]
KNLIALLPLLFCFLSPAHAQIPAGNYFQGYQRAIHGFPFNYHSPIPDVTASLIVRANKDFRPIEWETA